MKGYSRQAFAYAALKQPGRAEEAYRRGLSKDPSNTGLRQMLAAFLQVFYYTPQSYCLSLTLLSGSVQCCRISLHAASHFIQG